MIQVLRRFLEARGHQVVEAEDGFQLVERAKQWRPDIIVTDIVMPGVYGSTAYKSLLDDPVTSRTPFVFVTAVSEHPARLMVPESPNVRMLQKPVDLDALERCVMELLKPPTAV
jgi:CheY-like chemotaxis protein